MLRSQIMHCNITLQVKQSGANITFQKPHETERQSNMQRGIVGRFWVIQTKRMFDHKH